MSYALTYGTVKKTRKPHHCRYCGETIPTGSSCYRASGFTLDGAWVIHMHHECEPMTREWDSADWEDIPPGSYERPGNHAQMDAR